MSFWARLTCCLPRVKRSRAAGRDARSRRTLSAQRSSHARTAGSELIFAPYQPNLWRLEHICEEVTLSLRWLFQLGRGPDNGTKLSPDLLTHLPDSEAQRFPAHAAIRDHEQVDIARGVVLGRDIRPEKKSDLYPRVPTQYPVEGCRDATGASEEVAHCWIQRTRSGNSPQPQVPDASTLKQAARAESDQGLLHRSCVRVRTPDDFVRVQLFAGLTR